MVPDCETAISHLDTPLTKVKLPLSVSVTCNARVGQVHINQNQM